MMMTEECCGSGQEGSDAYLPAGYINTISSIKVYQSLPASRPKGVLLLLPDGFGLAQHNFILADKFADQGWHVILPDYYEGDPLPIELLRRDPAVPLAHFLRENNFKDLGQWKEQHSHVRISGLLHSPLDAVQNDFVILSCYAIGYCFGGKHAIRLATSGKIKASVAFHPSFVVEGDTEGISVPLFVGFAGNDEMVSATLVPDMNSWLTTRRVTYEARVYPGMRHGFAARPEIDDPLVKTQYLQAFNDAVHFLATQWKNNAMAQGWTD